MDQNELLEMDQNELLEMDQNDLLMDRDDLLEWTGTNY